MGRILWAAHFCYLDIDYDNMDLKKAMLSDESVIYNKFDKNISNTMTGCPNFPPKIIRHFWLLNQQEFDSNISTVNEYKFTCIIQTLPIYCNMNMYKETS